MANDIPRRIRLDRMTPAELAIRAAVEAVESAGADPLLTEAIDLLSQAKSKVADYVDRKMEREEMVRVIEDAARAEYGPGVTVEVVEPTPGNRTERP